MPRATIDNALSHTSVRTLDLTLQITIRPPTEAEQRQYQADMEADSAHFGYANKCVDWDQALNAMTADQVGKWVTCVLLGEDDPALGPPADGAEVESATVVSARWLTQSDVRQASLTPQSRPN